jgi:hypothetical protein
VREQGECRVRPGGFAAGGWCGWCRSGCGLVGRSGRGRMVCGRGAGPSGRSPPSGEVAEWPIAPLC